MDIFQNKKHWENMDEDELNEYVTQIFNHYKLNGFPYYPKDREYRDNEFQKLKNYDYNRVWFDGTIGQSMHGLALAWSYFPHSFDVRCSNKLTPLKVFNDDDMFIKVIRRRLSMGTYISDSGIRKMLKIYSGVQGVSNFRPTAAACVYNRYSKNGVVWDMSGGWGGRFLGAVIGGVKKYIATEPSTKTYEGLVELAKDYNSGMEYEILKMGSEDYNPNKESLDLCFTSPPYFDLEEYANENTQSFIKYPTSEKWVSGFLKKTIENCYNGLKMGGHMIINIADNPKNNLSLEDATISLSKSIGFEHVETHKLALSNINLKNKDKKFKYEPMFVFKK